MPSTLIETRAGWIDRPQDVIAAVHAAVAEHLRIPPWDRTVRLIEHAPSHFATPPNRGERFTFVQISMFAGRTLATKRALYAAIVEALEGQGVPRNDVTINLVEAAPENWGIRGGQAACDIDVGFKIEV